MMAVRALRAVAADTQGLYSLVYSSSAAESFDATQLESLLARSRLANAAHGITGMLLYRKRRFIQFLEGPESQVRALFARISADPRHNDVRVVVDSHPASREFADWRMGYEPVREPDGSAPEGFRSTLDDLESTHDAVVVVRAALELGIWFRVRAGRHG